MRDGPAPAPAPTSIVGDARRLCPARAHLSEIAISTDKGRFFMFSFLSGERKENQKRKPGTRLGWSAAPARQRNLPSPQKYFAGLFFFRSFSFCERKRTKKKAQEPAWVGPLRPPVSGACLPRKKYFAGLFFEKPRREKWVTDEGGGLPNRRETDDRRGLPAGLRASPSPLRFLFFGSFFSFPERKERT